MQEHFWDDSCGMRGCLGLFSDLETSANGSGL